MNCFGTTFMVQAEFHLGWWSTKVVNKRNLFSVCILTGLVGMRPCHCLIQSWKPLQLWDKWLDRLQVCQRTTLLRVHLFSRRCKSYRPVNDWVPARINNVMWWHPSLHERLSTRAKALVVIATTGAQYYYELIICGGSADRSARRRWADKGKKRIWFSILDVITEPFHA